MDTGGWVSVNALNRFKVIYSTGRKAPMHMILGVVWGGTAGPLPCCVCAHPRTPA